MLCLNSNSHRILALDLEAEHCSRQSVSQSRGSIRLGPSSSLKHEAVTARNASAHIRGPIPADQTNRSRVTYSLALNPCLLPCNIGRRPVFFVRDAFVSNAERPWSIWYLSGPDRSFFVVCAMGGLTKPRIANLTVATGAAILTALPRSLEARSNTAIYSEAVCWALVLTSTELVQRSPHLGWGYNDVIPAPPQAHLPWVFAACTAATAMLSSVDDVTWTLVGFAILYQPSCANMISASYRTYPRHPTKYYIPTSPCTINRRTPAIQIYMRRSRACFGFGARAFVQSQLDMLWQRRFAESCCHLYDAHTGVRDGRCIPWKDFRYSAGACAQETCIPNGRDKHACRRDCAARMDDRCCASLPNIWNRLDQGYQLELNVLDSKCNLAYQ